MAKRLVRSWQRMCEIPEAWEEFNEAQSSETWLELEVHRLSRADFQNIYYCSLNQAQPKIWFCQQALH